MKKLLSLFLAMTLALALAPCAFADGTDTRDIIEFCELYMQRITLFQIEENMDFDIRPSLSLFTHPELDDGIMFSCSAGSAIVSPDDYKVIKFDTILYDYNDTDDENDQHDTESIIAFSALEYDSTDDSIIGLSERTGLGDGSENAVDKSYKLWSSDDFLEVYGAAISEAAKTGEEVFLYSGNYDYYIRYVAMENLEQLWLIARAK